MKLLLVTLSALLVSITPVVQVQEVCPPALVIQEAARQAPPEEPPTSVAGWLAVAEENGVEGAAEYWENSLELFTWDHVVKQLHVDILDRFPPHYDIGMGKAFIAGGRVWSADHLYKMDPWLGTDVHLIGDSAIEGLTISETRVEVGAELYIRTRRGVVRMVVSNNLDPRLQQGGWAYQVRFTDPENMVQGGDSGSPVLRTDTNEVVALVSGYFSPLPPPPVIIVEGEEEGEAAEPVVVERYGFMAILERDTLSPEDLEEGVLEDLTPVEDK